MKVLLSKFDDFLEKISSSQIHKEVFFQVENIVQPLKVKNEDGSDGEAHNEDGSDGEAHKIVSIFRATSSAWDPEKKKEDWIGCNVVLASEVVGTEGVKEIGMKIDAERNALIKRMKDKLVGNGIILAEGIVVIEG